MYYYGYQNYAAGVIGILVLAVALTALLVVLVLPKEKDGHLPSVFQMLYDLFSPKTLVMEKRSKKAKSGFTEVDLIPLIARATVEERRDTIALDLVLRAQNPGLNPELVVAAIREHCPDAAPDFVIFHRRAVLDGQFQNWE